MKNIFKVSFLFLCHWTYSQDLAELKIDSIYREILSNLQTFKKVVIAIDHENFDTDTILYYFDNNNLRYIIKYTKENTSEFAFDSWIWQEFVRLENKLILQKTKSRTDVYDEVPEENATTRVGDSKNYYNLDGKAIQIYLSRGVEGTRITADSLLNLQPWKVAPPEKLKYFNSYSKDDKQYINILVEKFPKYSYLLNDKTCE